MRGKACQISSPSPAEMPNLRSSSQQALQPSNPLRRPAFHRATLFRATMPALMKARVHMTWRKRREAPQQERSITAAVFYAQSAKLPSEAALISPGLLRGPLRFIPPTPRVYQGLGVRSLVPGQQASDSRFHNIPARHRFKGSAK